MYARLSSILIVLAAVLLTVVPASAQKQAVRYQIYEESMLSSKPYANPLQDVQVTVEIKDPRGRTIEVEAFWDGFNIWKFRYMPRTLGPHTYSIRCSDTSNGGLNAPGDVLNVVEYNGTNRLWKRGPIVLSESRRQFAQADTSPFFLVSDTAWNGPLLADEEEWVRYLRERKEQGFNTIQFVTTQWRAAYADRNGQKAFDGIDRITVNPSFFQRLDRHFQLLNENEFVGLPVALWALTSNQRESPGDVLPQAQAALLARYIVARYNAFHVIWFLGGDGDYRGDKGERWKAIAKEVFPPQRKTHLVSLHPRGMQDPWPALKDETWLDFLNYQTGHGGDARKWKWNATEGTATGWKLEPARPVFDSEPNYENHTSYQGAVIGAYDVRRASWYSVLGGPPAGITYGTHGVWPWMREIGIPLNHPNSGSAMPWFASLDNPGVEGITVMAEILQALEWWKLEPTRAILAGPPAKEDYSNHIQCGRADSREFALCYVPAGVTPELNTYSFLNGARAIWIDPRTGVRQTPLDLLRKDTIALKPPNGEDWVLLIQRR